MDAQKFGSFIAQVRKEQNMTQTDLAAKLQVTDKAVSRWERGLGFPDIKTLEPLADALGLSVLELMKSERTNEELISSEKAEQAVSNTVNLAQKQQDENKRNIFLATLCILLILIMVYLLGVKYWLPILIFVSGIAVCFVSRHFYKEAESDEKAGRIYGVIFFIALAVTVNSGIYLLPEAVLLQYESLIFLLIFLLIDVVLIRNALGLYMKKSGIKKETVIFNTLLIIIALCFSIFITVRQVQKISSKPLDDKIEITSQYAEQLLLNDCHLKEEWITGRFNTLGNNNGQLPDYYFSVFTYQLPDENSEQIYGYQMTIDDKFRIQVLNQGPELGKSIVSETTAGS